MNIYIGCKIVKARESSLFLAQTQLNRSIQYDGLTDEYGNCDGYLVEYEDGYQSWSPKNVFEESYRKIVWQP